MKKTMKRIIALTLGMSVAMGMTACSSEANVSVESKAEIQTEESNNETGVSAAENYTLMFGHAQTETHPYQACFKAWADNVAEKTNGGLVIDLYPSNTLGSEEDIINSFKDSDTNWGYNTDFARLGTYVQNLLCLICHILLRT